MSYSENVIPESLIINNDNSVEFTRQNSDTLDGGMTSGPDETTSLLSFRKEFFESSCTSSRQFYDSTYTIDSTTGDSGSFDSTSSFSTSVRSMLLKLPSSRRGSAISVTSNNIAMHFSMLHTYATDFDADRSSDILSTIFSLLPLLQGIPIFVIPYVFLTAGLWFIPVSISLCILADVSSKLLIECLYKHVSHGDIKTRIHNGIHGVATSCIGAFGGNAVYSFVVFNLIANNIVNVIIFDKCFRDLFRSSLTLDMRLTTVIYVVILTSMLYVKKVSALILTGFLGSIGLAVASATASITFFRYTKNWAFNFKTLPMSDLRQFPLAASMFMYSLLANPIIPEIEAGMINPYKIGTALHASYGISTVFKVLFGVFGVLSYAFNTNEFAAINVGESTKAARYFITISIMLCTASNFSIPYHVVFDKLDLFVEYRVSASCREGKRSYIFWFIFSRTIGVILTVLIANKLPHYSSVVAVVGSIAGTTLVFVLPPLFHLILHWDHLSIARRFFELLMIIFGVVFGSICVYMSSAHLWVKII